MIKNEESCFENFPTFNPDTTQLCLLSQLKLS